MKQIRLSEDEIKDLKDLLNVAISGCLDDALVLPFEEQRKAAIKQSNKYKRLYNKIIEPTYAFIGVEEHETEI